MDRWLLSFLLLLMSLPLRAAKTWQFTILHTNDVHGALLPFDYPGNPDGGQPALADVGGVARRATAIAQIRRRTGHALAVVDAGDLAMGGPWGLKFHGEPDVEALNLMGYDLMCVGNHEFRCAMRAEEAQRFMLNLVQHSHFPWLSANLTVGDTGVPVAGIHPFVVRKYGQVRVGFLGLTTYGARNYPQLKGWTISDPITAAKTWVPRARKECDILIAVTHLGVNVDIQLATKVPGIDVIIGGHSHTFLTTPLMVNGPSGCSVPIVQAGEYGVMFGQLDLTFAHENGWKLKTASDRLIHVDHTFAEDPAVKAMLEHYLGPEDRQSTATDFNIPDAGLQLHDSGWHPQ